MKRCTPICADLAAACEALFAHTEPDEPTTIVERDILVLPTTLIEVDGREVLRFAGTPTPAAVAKLVERSLAVA